MKFTSRPLQDGNVTLAYEIDKKWFGEYAISEAELKTCIQENPNNTLALFQNETFEGFATFEILENTLPTDYVGNIPDIDKALFIQQFTTSTNYSKNDMQMDSVLLKVIEQKATELGCNEVWEALAVEHPYSKSLNPEYDAFGFYQTSGYCYDENSLLTWKPNTTISIPCYLFRKKVTQ
jgi:hypothetical protein